jgi:hypothetical protein
MEQWQQEALEALFEAQIQEVEEGQRVYVSSDEYGKSVYHLVEKRSNGIQIEQIDVDEKWSKRINFSSDELPAVLKTLLLWHLEAVQEQQRLRAEQQAPGAANLGGALDELDELDERPF